MTYDTINDAVTMAGNSEGMILANRYRVVRQLGAGGMGSVWLAEDTQLDNKPFAIKMLPAILVSNKRAYRQLKDEALVAMRLVHPNIVQIRAFEENNGNPFLVMDYIDGQTLDDYLAEYFPADTTPADVARPPRPCCKGEGALATSPGTTGVPPVTLGLPEADVIRILKPIAAALDYAHTKGVVHRDVKPGNVMIAKDGTPYILDFGIAREIQETMTRVTGKLSSGTLLYMSPEQLNGDMPKKEQDIYSFAAMTYECLKGEPPFVRGAIEDQIKNKQPEPLTCAGTTGSLPVGVNGQAVRSTSIAASVMAGLAKKPEDRPTSCMAVVAGEGFNRVERAEHVECVEGDGFSHKERKERKEVGRGVPTAPHGMSPSIRPQADATGSEAAGNPQQMAIRARVEAKICQKHLAELPNVSGIGVRKRALEDDFLRAEMFFESGAWIEAATKYHDYIKKCDNVSTLACEMGVVRPRRTFLELLEQVRDRLVRLYQQARMEFAAEKLVDEKKASTSEFPVIEMLKLVGVIFLKMFLLSFATFIVGVLLCLLLVVLFAAANHHVSDMAAWVCFVFLLPLFGFVEFIRRCFRGECRSLRLMKVTTGAIVFALTLGFVVAIFSKMSDGWFPEIDGLMSFYVSLPFFTTWRLYRILKYALIPGQEKAAPEVRPVTAKRMVEGVCSTVVVDKPITEFDESATSGEVTVPGKSIEIATQDCLKFACPNCGQHFEAEADMVGMDSNCPLCGQSFKVPEEDVASCNISKLDRVKGSEEKLVNEII